MTLAEYYNSLQTEVGPIYTSSHRTVWIWLQKFCCLFDPCGLPFSSSLVFSAKLEAFYVLKPLYCPSRLNYSLHFKPFHGFKKKKVSALPALVLQHCVHWLPFLNCHFTVWNDLSKSGRTDPFVYGCLENIICLDLPAHILLFGFGRSLVIIKGAQKTGKSSQPHPSLRNFRQFITESWDCLCTCCLLLCRWFPPC